MSDTPVWTPASEGLWMTWRPDNANEWSAKQVALLDAIMALSVATPGNVDSSTTAELACQVGCTVEEAWFALLGTEYAISDWPEQIDRPFLADPEDIDAEHRGSVRWSLPEADYDDEDEDWYGRRIVLAERLGQAGVAAWWRNEASVAGVTDEELASAIATMVKVKQ